jgi:hypothetical protein
MTVYDQIIRSDIRKGDRIRATWTHGVLTYTIEGVAATQDSHGDWLVSGLPRYDLNITNLYRTNEVLHLIERPKKPLPTAVGNVIRITKIYNKENDWSFPSVGVVNINEYALCDGDGDWLIISLNESRSGSIYIKPEDVLEWTPLNISDRTED